ncbi:MAG: hypothetical protein IJH63_12270 [Methanobrevibacter sp.]|nr:hypothetical protein [Methanobrevibacter sp.]
MKNLGGDKIKIRPIDDSMKNKYDSILKIATHAFTNALITLVCLPEE